MKKIWKILRREVRLVLHSIRDLLVLHLPDFSKEDEYQFAFLVHPRDIRDVYQKYPIMRGLPKAFVEWFLLYYWPVIVSRVTGLRSQVYPGAEVPGFVLAIPLTAAQMMENRALAKKRIKQAVKLARKSGARIIGLGGLTSSLSRGGLDLVDVTDIHITTGHAYTAYNVTKNFFALMERLEVHRKDITIAIVGAAGSIGSTSALILARAGYTNIILLDLARKHDAFPALSEEMMELNPNLRIRTSQATEDLKQADVIITATNAPEVLIHPHHLKPGAVIIDDAQPSDVHPDVLNMPDVLVTEAGVVYTPNVNSHFNFNLKGRNDNFCCMAEVLILASKEHRDHYVINRATLEDVDEISAEGRPLEFTIGAFQNFKESIDDAKLDHIKSVIHRNSTV